MNDIQSTLDAIDAAVEQMCACGCGARLDPDGPSQWYATPDCQWRYQQQHANGPGDVYNRPDNGDVWADCTGWREPPNYSNSGAFRDAFAAPGERIPYQFLSGDEREALHAWVELHGVDHTTVPIEGPITFDEMANEWLIEVFRQRDGNSYLDDDGQVAREVLRRPWRAALPWPVREA